MKIVVLAIGVAGLTVGCGGEREVGGECEYNADCNERCLTGQNFPGGMCTVACDDSRDCPGGTACVERRDGVCLPECEGDRDCPGGFECQSHDRRGEGGDVRICIGD